MSRAKKKKGGKLKVGFLMDPIEDINLETDTTLVLMMETQRRGHHVFYLRPEDVWVENGDPLAMMCRAKVRKPASPRSSHYSLGDRQAGSLSSLDLLFNRVDPPYSLEYVTLVQMLGLVSPPTVVVNRPRGVLEANEKILAMHFPGLMPPTIVSQQPERIKEFLAKSGPKIVLKDPGGFGGEGVVVVEKGHTNENVLIETMTKKGKKRVLAQKYLDVARTGDKRIIMLAGEPIGAMLRLPARGDHRANLHSGGRAANTAITQRDLDICKAVGPMLRREGLYLAGLDIVDGFLTEINMTSPTLVQQINRFEGVKLEERIMDFCTYLVDSARAMVK